MLRSEMIKVIKKALYAINFHYKKEKLEIRADVILKAIEKAGMLPPAPQKEEYNGFAMQHMWEKE